MKCIFHSSRFVAQQEPVLLCNFFTYGSDFTFSTFQFCSENINCTHGTFYNVCQYYKQIITYRILAKIQFYSASYT